MTSYETMRRDQELYKGEDFFCEVIDEAQYIKNAGTKGARAVKSVSAQMKLALTGTPGGEPFKRTLEHFRLSDARFSLFLRAFQEEL